MDSPGSILDHLLKALEDLRRGTIGAGEARSILKAHPPAKPAGKLAALFGADAIPVLTEAVLAQIRDECEVLEQATYQPGDVIGGRYQVLKHHHGGFGMVYICRSLGPELYERSGNLCALKTPLPRHLANPELRESFLAEAARCVRLGPHPNLVLAYGLEEHNRLPFLVLEYIPDARNLLDEIADGRSDWRVALRVGLGVARGLAFAKLVHGDLKPVNLLLGPDGAPKVADFGLALAADEGSEEGLLAGTRGFIAPEMLRGHPARTVATDIYAFGVTLFVTATWRMPFSPGQAEASADPRAPDPREIRPDIPAEFATLILQCLEPLPERRPRSFDALAGRFADLHRSLLKSEPPVDPLPDVPAQADALVNLAQSQLNLGRPADALKAAEEAVAALRSNWKAHNAAGLARVELGRWAEASECYLRAAALAPDEVAPKANIAYAHWKAGEGKAAREHLLAAIRLAGARGHMGQLDHVSALAVDLLPERDAYEFLGAVLADNPRAAVTWNNRAILLRRMEAFPEALESAEKALSLNPTYARAYVQKANALLGLGRFDDALSAADRSIALDASLVGAHLAKVGALRALDRIADARAAVQRALALFPGNALLLRARDSLG